MDIDPAGIMTNVCPATVPCLLALYATLFYITALSPIEFDFPNESLWTKYTSCPLLKLFTCMFTHFERRGGGIFCMNFAMYKCIGGHMWCAVVMVSEFCSVWSSELLTCFQISNRMTKYMYQNVICQHDKSVKTTHQGCSKILCPAQTKPISS